MRQANLPQPGGQCTDCAAGKYNGIPEVFVQIVSLVHTIFEQDQFQLIIVHLVPPGRSSQAGSDFVGDCFNCVAGKYNNVEGGLCKKIVPQASLHRRVQILLAIVLTVLPENLQQPGVNARIAQLENLQQPVVNVQIVPQENIMIKLDKKGAQTVLQENTIMKLDQFQLIIVHLVPQASLHQRVQILLAIALTVLQENITTLRGGLCIYCTAGKYNDNTGQQQCTNCLAGTYNNEIGSISIDYCTPCAAGKSSPTGSDFVGDCFNCVAGKYNNVEGGLCKNCATGKYSSTVAATTCKNCEAGKYNDETGLSSCKDCVEGRYNNLEGFPSCRSCVAGKSSTEIGATSSSTCKDCPKGKYSHTAGPCINCLPGRYSGAVGTADDCSLCSAGKYSSTVAAESSNTCINCEAGKSSATGSDLEAAIVQNVPQENMSKTEFV